MARPTDNRPKGARPLKAGEAVRHALSQVLQRGDVHDAELAKHIITVTEVKMSVDLGHAHVFVVSLGGIKSDEMMAALKKAAPRLRAAVARIIKLRHAPELHFILDTSFDYADRIGKVFYADTVQRDLSKVKTEESEE